LTGLLPIGKNFLPSNQNSIVEKTNNRETNRKIFSEYITDPSAINSDSADTLRSLLEKFPYSQLLRSFYARSLAGKDPAVFEKELARAALFSPDRSLLQIIIEDPARLTKAPLAEKLTV